MRFYGLKITAYDDLTDIITTLLGGPKPDVDYGREVAKMPKLRARLDYIDRSLFSDVTPLLVFTLLDPKPDSMNHVNHLII